MLTQRRTHWRFGWLMCMITPVLMLNHLAPAGQNDGDEQSIGTFKQRGTVVRIGRGRLTIASPAGPTLTYPVRRDARITRNGEDAGLEDLQQGDRVEVTSEVQAVRMGSRVALVPEGPAEIISARSPRPSERPERQADRDAKLGVMTVPTPRGTPVVVGVQANSPAARAGIRVGDYILAVDETEISSVEHLRRVVGRIQPGETASVRLWRNGSRLSVNARFPSRAGDANAAEEKRQETAPAHEHDGRREREQTRELSGTPWLGVMLARTPDERGVFISRVYLRSPAARAGLQPGDRIVEIEGESITSPREVPRQIRRFEPESRVEITVARNGTERSVPVRLGSLENFHQRLFGEGFREEFEGFHRLFDADFDGVPDYLEGSEPPASAREKESVQQSIQQLRQELGELKRQFEQSRGAREREGESEQPT